MERAYGDQDFDNQLRAQSACVDRAQSLGGANSISAAAPSGGPNALANAINEMDSSTSDLRRLLEDIVGNESNPNKEPPRHMCDPIVSFLMNDGPSVLMRIREEQFELVTSIRKSLGL